MLLESSEWQLKANLLADQERRMPRGLAEYLEQGESFANAVSKLASEKSDISQ